MTIENWSDNILLCEVQDDPQFTDVIESLMGMVEKKTDQDVIIDFTPVTYLNSSNIAKLLKLRKQIIINNGRKFRLCGLNTHVWGVFLVTGLDKVFEFTDDRASALASVQLER